MAKGMESQRFRKLEPAQNRLEGPGYRFRPDFGIYDVTLVDPPLQILDQILMNPDDPMLLALPDQVDLAQMQFNILRLQGAQFGSSQACVDKEADDKLEISPEPMAIFPYATEKDLQLVGIEASRDRGSWLPEKFEFSGRIFLNPPFADRNIQIFPERLQVLIDRRSGDGLSSGGTVFLDRFGRDLRNGDLLEIFLEDIALGKIGRVTMERRGFGPGFDLVIHPEFLEVMVLHGAHLVDESGCFIPADYTHIQGPD